MKTKFIGTENFFRKLECSLKHLEYLLNLKTWLLWRERRRERLSEISLHSWHSVRASQESWPHLYLPEETRITLIRKTLFQDWKFRASHFINKHSTISWQRRTTNKKRNNCVRKYFSFFFSVEQFRRPQHKQWECYRKWREDERGETVNWCGDKALRDCQNNIRAERCYWKLINVERCECEGNFLAFPDVTSRIKY